MEHRTNTTEYEILEKASSKKLLNYSLIVAASIAIGFISFTSFVIFSFVASTNIHRQVFLKICYATTAFFDKNLSGNILNRLSRDVMIMDELLPYNILYFLQIALFTLAVLGVISAVKPFLAIPSVTLLIILYFARRFYLPTGRSIRRLEGSTRSPVIGHLNATVDGLTTIRSSAMAPVVIREFENHLDLYNSVVFMSLATTRGFGLLLEMSCIFYVSVLTFTMMAFRNGLFSGQVGLAITQSLTLSGVLLQFGVKQWSEIENRMTSVERLMEYTKIDSEKQAETEPPDWPNEGKIAYNKVSLRYPSTGDLVLKEILITIKGKEKTGVVGRTGAGKSSLISVLYRLYDYDGNILVDDFDTKDVSIQYLRSKISIIPQDPFIFSGTLRDNLDPYKEFSDEQLWNVLKQVEMIEVCHNLYEEISDEGNKFSIGQKQLICLARAILRKNSILVLDEATASLDFNTDALIQRTISRNFGSSTVITIAHRISTVLDCDTIIVMEEGRVAECGTPEELLKDKNGKFYSIARDAGILI